MRFIFAQNLRTISVSAQEQSLKFSIKVVNKLLYSSKCRKISKVHFASRLFTHVQLLLFFIFFYFIFFTTQAIKVIKH